MPYSNRFRALHSAMNGRESKSASENSTNVRVRDPHSSSTEMKLRITSIVASEVGELISEVTTNLEDRLRPLLEQRDYGAGIQQFAVFFVSVNSDPIENERFCVANNRASRYKDLLTGEVVSFVGLAVPVDPVRVLESTREALPKLLQGLLLEELQDPAYALPKKFDGQRLLGDMTSALSTE